jgi:hypothetical protein
VRVQAFQVTLQTPKGCQKFSLRLDAVMPHPGSAACWVAVGPASLARSQTSSPGVPDSESQSLISHWRCARTPAFQALQELVDV